MAAEYAHMVRDYYVRKLRSERARRGERLAALQGPECVAAYLAEVQAAIDRAFTPVPEKTPLNPRVHDTLNRPGYRIEKLSFESRPGCLVTANLYLPEVIDGPRPTVLMPCGHSAIGKAEPFYQHCCQRLARAGYVTLIYEPFNQGERDQYYGLPEDTHVRQNCCHAHNMMGKQQELVGEFFGMWRAWDGIRAHDYLLTRSEVDAKTIVVAGNSGGGTMSTWLRACDDRLAASAPSCFVTTFMANLENEMPADCEQYPPGILAAGLEMVDLLMLRAPRPLFLMGQRYCFFDRRGLVEGYDELKQVYRLLDAENAIGMFMGEHGHGFYDDAQKALVKFLCGQFGGEADDSAEVVTETPETLAATAEGNVIAAGGQPIFKNTQARAEQLHAARSELTNEELLAAVKRVLTISDLPDDVPRYRIPRGRTTPGGEWVGRYAVETEPGIEAILHKLDVCGQTLDIESSVILYLGHLSAVADIDAGELPERAAVYAVDCRGLGASAPAEEGPFTAPYGMDYMMHGHGILFDESYLGRRVFDVCRVMQLMRAEGAERIRIFGRGQGAIIGLFAAMLDGDCKLVYKNGPLTFQEWCEVPIVEWPAASFPRGVLHEFDLPDCFRQVAGRLKIVEPWGPLMTPTGNDDAERTLRLAGLEGCMN